MKLPSHTVKMIIFGLKNVTNKLNNKEVTNEHKKNKVDDFKWY